MLSNLAKRFGGCTPKIKIKINPKDICYHQNEDYGDIWTTYGYNNQHRFFKNHPVCDKCLVSTKCIYVSRGSQDGLIIVTRPCKEFMKSLMISERIPGVTIWKRKSANQ